MGMGFMTLVIVVGFLALLTVTAVAVVWIFRGQVHKAREFGYPSLTAYLRAAPRNDEERRAAADLALKGLVVCLLGLLFRPLLLLGLIPFFYGARKVMYASMGLGLADDANGQER